MPLDAREDVAEPPMEEMDVEPHTPTTSGRSTTSPGPGSPGSGTSKSSIELSPLVTAASTDATLPGPGPLLDGPTPIDDR
jgi:hypothetical protein